MSAEKCSDNTAGVELDDNLDSLTEHDFPRPRDTFEDWLEARLDRQMSPRATEPTGTYLSSRIPLGLNEDGTIKYC